MYDYKDWIQITMGQPSTGGSKVCVLASRLYARDTGNLSSLLCLFLYFQWTVNKFIATWAPNPCLCFVPLPETPPAIPYTAQDGRE